MTPKKLKIIIATILASVGVTLAFYISGLNVEAYLIEGATSSTFVQASENNYSESANSDNLMLRENDSHSAPAQIRRFFTALETVDKKQVESKIRGEQMTDLIGRLSNSEIVDLLDSREVKSGGIASFYLLEAIWRIKTEQIETKPTLVQNFVSLKKPSNIQRQFLGYLAKNSKWFSAANIGTLSDTNDVLNDLVIITGIRNRLGDEFYEGGEGGKSAAVAEYLSMLPDSMLRDEIYASGYLSALSPAELLAIRDTLIQSKEKHTKRRDEEYAKLLIENNYNSKAENLFDELLKSGDKDRATSVARSIVHYGNASPINTLKWADALPTSLPRKNDVVLIAFRKLSGRHPEEARARIAVEKDTELARAFQLALDFHQRGSER